MNKGGIIVCEHASGEMLPQQAGDFIQGRGYQYGKIMLTVYEHKDVVAQ